VISVERVDFLTVPIPDVAEADRYFGELGLFERNPRSMEEWVEYETPNVTLALDQSPFGDAPLPFGAFAIRVDDVAAERERLEGKVEFRGDSFDSGVCHGALFVALGGNGMLLHHRYEPFADGSSPDRPRGRIDFVAIPTRDRDRAEEFYGGVLGLERNPRSSERWVEYETSNLTLALVDPVAIGWEFRPLPPGTIALRVADVAAAKDELESAGVEFPHGAGDSGVCWVAPFSDPDGNGLMLHRRHAPFSDGTMP
jgi:extradiol dioxygenase family protein